MRTETALVACVAFTLLCCPPAFAQDEPGAPDTGHGESPPPGAPDTGDGESPPPAPAPPLAAPTPAPAAAQAPAPHPAGAPGRAQWPAWLLSGRIAQPPSFALLPLESGALDTRVQLLLAYTHIADLSRVSVDAAMMALEGQYAIADRFAVGLTFPFLLHAVASSASTQASETELGNLALNLKAKVVGRSGGQFALSLFLNTTFPTATGVASHEYALMQGGGAVSGALGVVTLGADLGVWGLINGRGQDGVAILFDFYTHVQIHRVFAAYAAFQVAGPVHPDTGNAAFTITPGLRVTPAAGLFFDVAGRIAATDGARLMHTLLGRGDLIFNVGYRFL